MEFFTLLVVDHVFELLLNHGFSSGTLGLTKPAVVEMLLFVFRNYEVSFNGRAYMQVAELPMSARFAPPYVG